MLVINFCRFVHEPQIVVDECFEFLGVPSVEVEPRYANQSSGDSEMPMAIEEKLRAFYRPHNRDLYDLLDRDFGWPA